MGSTNTKTLSPVERLILLAIFVGILASGIGMLMSVRWF